MRVAAKLSSHSGSVCCVKATEDERTVLSGAEDGTVAAFDLRTEKLLDRLHLTDSDTAVPSIATNPDNDFQYFCCCSATTYSIDRRKAGHHGVLQEYSFNRDEINSLAINPKGTLLAAADDAGDVTVIDLRSGSLLRSLRDGHSNIASSVSFRAHRPWELLSGGLDAKVNCWDFSSGRALNTWELGKFRQTQEAQGGISQVCNPPFVHCIAVPAGAERPFCKIVAVACGNGAVSVFDADVSKKAHRTGHTTPAQPIEQPIFTDQMHSAATNHVSFPKLGEGNLLASGGNDGDICIIDWTRRLPEDSSFHGRSHRAHAPLVDGVLRINHGRKVNCIAVTGKGSLEHLLVADVSKSISIYSLQ